MWVGFHLERRRAGTLAFTRTHDLVATAQGPFGYLLQLPRVCFIVAIGLVAVALARPQRLSTDPAEAEGIDIVTALHVATSMQETDRVPDRITPSNRVIDASIRPNSSHPFAHALLP